MLLVALGWWWRRSRWLPGYGIAVAAAAFTHFYGLFVFAAAVVWGSWRRRWGLMATAVLALLPALAWIAYASAYLLSSRLGQWIGTPDFALLEDTLAPALGPWPLPKLGVLVLWVSPCAAGAWPDWALTITRPVGVSLRAEDCLMPAA